MLEGLAGEWQMSLASHPSVLRWGWGRVSSMGPMVLIWSG
jgi:hypothetical protein